MSALSAIFTANDYLLSGYCPRRTQSKCLVDSQAGAGPVQRIKVNTVRPVIDKIPHLFGRPMDSRLFKIIIAVGSDQRSE